MALGVDLRGKEIDGWNTPSVAEEIENFVVQCPFICPCGKTTEMVCEKVVVCGDMDCYREDVV